MKEDQAHRPKSPLFKQFQACAQFKNTVNAPKNMLFLLRFPKFRPKIWTIFLSFRNRRVFLIVDLKAALFLSLKVCDTAKFQVIQSE